MDKQTKIKRAMHDEIARLRAALDAAETRAQEAILDAIAAQGQAAEAHDAQVKAEAERDATRVKALEDAAYAGYVVCAETRHVTLGDKVAAAIRAMKKPKP